MYRMKVFITVEEETGDQGTTVKKVINKCLDIRDALSTLGVPIQLKVTTLPRKRYTGASEI